MSRKLTLEEVISNYKKIHGNKFSYENTVYSGALKPLTVTCNSCKISFSVQANSFKKTKDCPNKCYSSKENFLKWLEYCKKFHNNKYDYSLVDYKRYTEPVCIICPIHGSFSQTPKEHKQHGCQNCGTEKSSTSKLLDLDILKERFNKIYNNKYDYSLITKENYKGLGHNLKIICPVHKEFKQTGINHLQGRGCKYCSEDRRTLENRDKYFQEYLNKAKEIWNDKYEYSKYIYLEAKKASVIICPVHGEFKKSMDKHTRLPDPQGCPSCSMGGTSKAEKSLLSWLNSLGYNFKPSNIPGSKLKLDMCDKDLGIAIEYNGAYWHSTKHKENEYHLNKYTLCKNKGIILIHIFEFENIFKWKRKLYDYLRDPSNYIVSFSNNKRSIDNSYICYGQSYIKRI